MKPARKNDIDVFEGDPSLAKVYSLIRGWRRANRVSADPHDDVKVFVINRTIKQKSAKEEFRALAEKLCKEHPAISTDREVLGGRPHINNTRLSVENVLAKLYLYGSIQAILDIYEHLSEEQIKEAIAYAQDFLEIACDPHEAP